MDLMWSIEKDKQTIYIWITGGGSSNRRAAVDLSKAQTNKTASQAQQFCFFHYSSFSIRSDSTGVYFF
jgi:hypothetical protein